MRYIGFSLGPPILDLPSGHLFIVVLKPLEVDAQCVWQGFEADAPDCIHLITMDDNVQSWSWCQVRLAPAQISAISACLRCKCQSCCKGTDTVRYLASGLLTQILILSFHEF